jgi:hypothetical protein
MENNNRNPYSKRNKQQRQHQQHSQEGSNNCGAPTPQVVLNQQPISNVRINQSLIVNCKYNPKEDESHSNALRQQMLEVRIRYQSDIPRVRDPNRFVGYYDIKVHLDKSTNPWEEVIEAFCEMMVILWSSDLTIKIYVFNEVD